MFSLMLVALCLFVGAAVDIGRWVQARHQTIAAMDAAVLAGGRVLQVDEKNLAGAKAAALQFYQENTKGRADVVDDTIGFDATNGNTAFTATGNAYIKTTFLNFANISKLPLLNAAKAEYSRAELQGGGNNNSESLEISLMLDVTGSMGGTKITDLKAAAKDLVNIVISDSAYARPARISLIPFSEGVRLPSSANAKARGNPPNTINVNYGWGNTSFNRTSCVVERFGTNKYKDTAPGSGNYVGTLYYHSSWGTGTCPLTSAEELIPLTNDKTLLTNRIDGLTINGSTAGQIGTAWAWYTLSPNWNTLWSSATNQAAAYGTGISKIAILMTDGEYNTQYASNGVQTDEYSAANGSSSSQAVSMCTGMKAKDITVYTVGFALGGNQTAINTLKSCATDATKAYTVETGAELKQVFREIALKISPLYLSH